MRAADVVVTLYLDSFFLLNMGMNFWLLFLTGRFLKLGTGPGRMLGAAGAGAAGGCVALVAAAGLQWGGRAHLAGISGLLLGPVFRLAVWGLGLGWLMVRLAFGKAGWRETGKRLAVLWMAAALTGGLLSAGYGRMPVPEKGGKAHALLVFGAAVAGASLAAAGCWNLVQARIHERRTICEAILSQKGKNIRVRALWDTGNQLFEPYTHQPVHVITREVCGRLCGPLWDPAAGVIFVPFQAVGTRSGILPAIRVESMDVVKEGGFRKHYDHPWLAVSEEALSPRGQYEMLLHGEEW